MHHNWIFETNNNHVTHLKDQHEKNKCIKYKIKYFSTKTAFMFHTQKSNLLNTQTNFI